MFQFIRKHQAIGLIFIGIVIVSFVIFFSPTQGGGGGTVTGSLGAIRGDPIDLNEYVAARKEAALAYMLRHQGQWPETGAPDWDEQREVFNRLFLLDEARRLGIEVPPRVAASRIVEFQFLRDERTGGFNRAAYDQFLASLLTERGITRAEFEQFMRHEIALQHLAQIGGLSGTLVTPREATAQFREANEHFGAQLVIFSASNHLASVDLSPTNVARHYTNRMAEYRIPERLQVRYVKFPATNFLSEADQQLNTNTNLVQILDAEYERRDPASFRDAEGNVMAPEAAKQEIRDLFRQNLALDAARKKANEFANRLYQLDPAAASLNQLAAEMNYQPLTSAPFDQMRPPVDMKVPTTFNRAAFALSPEEPFATPVTGEDAVYVFAFEQRIPSSIEPLENVQSRVTQSLIQTESREMAFQAAREFAAAVTNALAQGKTFEAAAAEAGHTVLTLTNFSRATTIVPGLPPRLTVSELLRTADELAVGQTSGFVPAADGGYVLHLTSREPVPEEVLKEELPEFLDQARQFGRFTAFHEWQRKRFAAADVRIPGVTNSVEGSIP
jgi:hypothetical protein